MALPNYDEISSTLKRLRSEAQLSARAAAERSGFSHSKITRFETGRLMPTADDMDTLCRLYGAPAETRRDLVATAREIREEATSGRVILQRGAWRTQQRFGRIEAASARVRSFDPTTVIGLLQTSDYIRAMWDSGDLSQEDLERFVEARLERQRLLSTDREFVLIMTEGALRYNLGGPSVMVGQLDHLTEATHMDNARVGVVSQYTAAGTPATSGFHLYDARAVIVGTLGATAIITNERDVADYEKHFTEMEALASFGPQAREVITRVTRDFTS